MKIFSSKTKVVDPKKEKKKGAEAPVKESKTRTTGNRELAQSGKTGVANYTVGEYAGYSGPRTGGKPQKPSTPIAKGTSSKKLIKKSIKSAKSRGGSYQAKAAALRAYKK
jgi:hypothetical protein